MINSTLTQRSVRLCQCPLQMKRIDLGQKKSPIITKLSRASLASGSFCRVICTAAIKQREDVAAFGMASYLDASSLQVLPHASNPTRRHSNV